MSAAFRADNGGTVRLGQELGRGGEGAVNAQLHDKVRVMAAHPPVDPTVKSLQHHSGKIATASISGWPTKNH